MPTPDEIITEAMQEAGWGDWLDIRPIIRTDDDQILSDSVHSSDRIRYLRLEPEVPEPEAPRPARSYIWTPQGTDLARVTRDVENTRNVVDQEFVLRAGQVVMIDRHGGACRRSLGVDGIQCHAQVSVYTYVLNPIDYTVDHDDRAEYVNVACSDLEPITDVNRSDYVRCHNPAHGIGGLYYRANAHECNSECVAPTRMCGRLEDGDTVVLASFRQVCAQDIEARAERRRARVAELNHLAVGDSYYVESRYSPVCGSIVTIRRPVDETGHVHCDVEDRCGGMLRRDYRINAFTLGARVYPWQRNTRVPSFIRFANPQYSGRNVTMSDREIVESLDDHECDNACFENGCTTVPATLSRSGRVPELPLDNCGCNECCTRRNDDDDNDDSHDYDDSVEERLANGVEIHSYSYRPELIFSGEGPVFLGTELELSTGEGLRGQRNQREAAMLLMRSPMGRLAYLKSDGSIAGYGFEAVFHPMSYDYYVEHWPEDLLRGMRNVGAVPHSSCGMHVHVSRTGFSDPVHAFKWIKFMYRNAGQMRQLARRDPSSWGSFSRPDERAAAKWHAKGGYGGGHRYTAINCIPEHTYEVRIFASTLNRTRLLGSLGLVDASVEYVRQLTTGDILHRGGWDFGPFREYVTSFRKYAPLQKEMVRILDK